MNEPKPADLLSIGQVAERTGLAVSAIRFYDDEGLVRAGRDAAGRRVFTRASIRRLSFILITQRLGYTLAQIRSALDGLPHESPTADDWARLAVDFRHDLDARIEAMAKLRDRLEGCIGCGCLSLEACAIYNPSDAVAIEGSGPRLVMNPDPNFEDPPPQRG